MLEGVFYKWIQAISPRSDIGIAFLVLSTMSRRGSSSWRSNRAWLALVYWCPTDVSVSLISVMARSFVQPLGTLNGPDESEHHHVHLVHHQVALGSDGQYYAERGEPCDGRKVS